MAAGAITVPLDKEMPAEDLAATIEKAKCTAVFYSSEIEKKYAVLKDNCPGVSTFVSMSEEL